MVESVTKIIADTVAELGRPDLFRHPLVGFSSAQDARYAELKTLIGPWHLLPTELLPSAKSVISYFVPFTKSVVSQPKTTEHGAALWAEAYQEINEHFNKVNDALVKYLKDEGHAAKTIKATHTYSPEDLQSMWSHRSAAAIAGLGTFGANRLLITEKGSGGRFCTVITSAVFEPNSTAPEEKCLYIKNKTCGLCLRICPVKALDGERVDKFACQRELNKNEALLLETTELKSADACGKCISVCPMGYIE